MFNRKNLVLSATAALCLLAPAATLVAQTATTTQTAPSNKKIKTIKFTVTNRTSSSLDLQSGTEQVSIAAGQSRELKAPAGTKLVTTSPSSAGQTGTVVAEVADGMNGSTINVR